MDIQKVTVTFAATINLGNYQNMRPEVRLEAYLEEDEFPKEVARRLHVLAREMVGLSLEDQVAHELGGYIGWHSIEPERRRRAARSQTGLFKWLEDLAPEAAQRVLDALPVYEPPIPEPEVARAPSGLFDDAFTDGTILVEFTDDEEDDSDGE